MARIDALFEQLLDQRGSDLHLGIGSPPLIRSRGDLVPLREAAITETEQHALLHELLNPSQRATIDSELDLDFAYAFGTRARFRANYFFKMTGLAAVFRVIPTQIKSLSELGTPRAIETLANLASGLVLVTGPTGSGKSTTLAAMIHHINQTRACHVLTIEDPVEFMHTPQKAQVTHREIGRDAVSFPVAIRSAGREDPNVVLIGELRGAETMKLALQLASFGILVFATVHTNSAASTIDRFINAFPADEQPQVRGLLAECLAGVVAQQLVKTTDGQGRVAVHEILIGTSGLSAMIREGKTFQIPTLIQSGQSQGMQSMDAALLKLVLDKKISPKDGLEKVADKVAFVKAIRDKGRASLLPPNLE